MTQQREVDLLVAGAGPAGMTAALVASLQGLSVLLCEKSDQVGGTGSTSAGTLWIPGNHQSRDAGFDDSAAKAEEYLDALVGSAASRELRTAFLKTGPAAIDYLERNTDVKFVPCGRHPDYRSNMKGAAVSGRAIIPQPFDGRLLGADFARLRPPIPEYMLFGGMMIGKADIPPLVGRFKSLANFSYAAKLMARYLDRPAALPARHAADDGQCAHRAAVLQPEASAASKSCSTRRSPPSTIRTAASSARQSRPQAARFTSKPRKGVVLATGGYGHNKQYREAFMPQPGARAFDGQRIQPGRRPRHRRAARRAHRAGRTRPQRAVDAGVPHARARTAARAFTRTCCSTAPSRA